MLTQVNRSIHSIVNSIEVISKQSELIAMCENLPFDKVSEVIDRDSRAPHTVAGKNMVYNGSTVILKRRKPD